MQAECAVAPELDLHRRDAEPRPVGRTRHLADRIFEGVSADLFHKLGPAFERAGLARGPGTDARIARTAGEVRVGFGLANHADGAADTNLTAQGFPVEEQRRPGLAQKLDALGALEVGEEDEAVRAVVLEQHHAEIRHTVGIDRRQRHRIGIVGLGTLGLGQPGGETSHRIAFGHHFGRFRSGGAHLIPLTGGKSALNRVRSGLNSPPHTEIACLTLIACWA